MEVVGVAEGASLKGAKTVDRIAEAEAILKAFGCGQNYPVQKKIVIECEDFVETH